MRWVTSREACKILNVHANTLRKWDEAGKIETIRLNGQRRYLIQDINELEEKERRTVLYARVSSNKQKDDLSRQIKYLQENYSPKENEKIEIIQDIGSGINFKRKGFLKLFHQLTEGEVSTIVVAHKDRLCRFGYDILEQLCQKYQSQILVLNQVNQSPQEELVKDLTTIITVFSCRIHGLRKYSKKIKEDKDLPLS